MEASPEKFGKSPYFYLVLRMNLPTYRVALQARTYFGQYQASSATLETGIAIYCKRAWCLEVAS